MPESLWMLRHNVGHRTQVFIGTLAIFLLARKGCQAEQHPGGYAVPRWNGVIHYILWAAHQGFVITARIEKSAILFIGKQLDSLIHQSVSFREPAEIKACLVKC